MSLFRESMAFFMRVMSFVPTMPLFEISTLSRIFSHGFFYFL